MPRGTPTTAPPSRPYVKDPAAQPISAPAPMPAAVPVISSAPAPAGSNVWRAGSICGASISSHFVTREPRLPSGFPGELVSGAPAGLLLGLAAPATDARIRKLDDLEQVDHVHRGADCEQAERRRADGRPDVPAAVLPERDEPRAEGGDRQ